MGDVLGANVDLAGAEVDLLSLPRREYRLKDVLDRVRADYDFIIVDCPPSLGILTLDCLCAADSFLVPLQTEYYALEGLSQLMATVRSVQRSLNKKIRIEGILLTMYDGRTNLAVQVVEEVKKHFGDRVYAAVVPRNVRLSEAPSHGKPITAYDRSCRGAAAYLAVAEEFFGKEPVRRETMAKAKGGLGKGFGALLGESLMAGEGEESGVSTLPMTLIEPNSAQPRKNFDPEAMRELTHSIAMHGVVSPITVRRAGDGYYQIIAGERRWRAARSAGLTEIPALVIEADDKTVMELALIENLQRQDLNPIEEAQGYHSLMEEYGLTQEQVAERVGKSRPAVANALRLLSLPAEAQQMLADGTLSAGHARAVLAIKDESLRTHEALEKMAGMSVRQAEKFAKGLCRPAEKPKEQAAPFAADYSADLAARLEGALGRRVRIEHGKTIGHGLARILWGRRPGALYVYLLKIVRLTQGGTSMEENNNAPNKPETAGEKQPESKKVSGVLCHRPVLCRACAHPLELCRAGALGPAAERADQPAQHPDQRGPRAQTPACRSCSSRLKSRARSSMISCSRPEPKTPRTWSRRVEALPARRPCSPSC